VLHLQLALDQPSQNNPFSRGFGSFFTMDPIEQTPQNNHDGRPKRRRLDGPSPGDTPALSRCVSSFNRAPIDAPSRAQLAENCLSDDPQSEDDSFTDRPFTQDPSLHPSPPSLPVHPTVTAAVAAAVSAINDSFVRAPPDLVPVHQLPPNEVKILLGHMEDGKCLVPLTTSIVRFTVRLFTQDQSLLPPPTQIDNKFSLTHGVYSKEEFASKYSRIVIFGRDRLFNKLCISSNAHHSPNKNERMRASHICIRHITINWVETKVP
jgi:hypothetical protein